ncbi:sensor domain-containing diguanylate cyclase [Paenibacillus hemerocallicola]|uniref:Sensor domain-containing diguanylate cyclase n=1 Tax=Paenibacillus hemerocallicola TaxID=1172614 RepID=A0A5C4SYP0_9BACL|nr:sensor domain-containing diguanylate cyclase [Paenibacillus hemerocallicola]TNJ59283.1 sensor domain-containing diguanylate cyclase [Paenibacillus hemerocallicola]
MESTSQWGFDRLTSGLMERSDVLRYILQSMSDSIMIVDSDGEIVYASSQHSCLTIQSRMDDYLENVHEQCRKTVIRTFYLIKKHGKPISAQYRYHSAGGWLWVEATGIPLADGNGKVGYIAVLMKDITQRKQAEESLRELAFHDPLTGLPNRRLFKEHLLQSLAHAKRSRGLLGLMYLDIDDFKLINDTMGHEAGDDFLRAFASRIKGCIREVDMVARMGGDEFTVLLPSVDSASSVEKVAKRIFTAISAPWETKGHRFSATVSGGVVVYPANGEDAATLLHNVDRALYRVKESGRSNYVFYDPAILKEGTA